MWFLALYDMLFFIKMDKEWSSSHLFLLKVELYIESGSRNNLYILFITPLFFAVIAFFNVQIIVNYQNSVFSDVDDLRCSLYTAKLEDIIFSY